MILKTFAQNAGATRFWERLGFTPRVLQLVAPSATLAPDRESSGRVGRSYSAE